MRIFLADLGHNLLTYSSDTYPLGVANIAAFLGARLEVDPLEIRIFREPQDLAAALRAGVPDVLGLSNYSWNNRLSRQFARFAKDKRPDVLTVMGGPNWPLTRDVQASFLAEMPEIDVYVDGPTYEGERAMLELMRRFVTVGHRVEGLLEERVPGNTWLDTRTGDLVVGGEVDRIRDLDEIPSPYLGGLLDPFFETGYFPLLQIARGCPFSCTFCNSGVESNSRISAHSVENVRQDLLYIAERVKPSVNLCLADDNFGMYPRDEEVADFLAWLQDRYNWPSYIRTTTGKNQAERIIRVMRKVGGALPMTAAVQSMNETVLENIKRSNIKLSTYASIQQELKEQGMQSYGELILSLPGETKATFMKSIEDLLDAGAQRISAHQLMLLHGAELSTPASRQRFGLETRFRVVARNIGDYLGEPVAEVEEMVVHTPTFSFDDYLDARVFHLLLTIFYYEGNYEEAFELARHAGIKAFDLITRMHAMLDRSPETFRQALDDFVRESREELFDTPEACVTWAREHHDALVDGSAGGNLLSKYSMIGRFLTAPESLQFLHDVLVSTLQTVSPGADTGELDAVIEYLDGVLLHVPFARMLDEERTWTSAYDVETWRASGYTAPLSAHRLATPCRFLARVDPERREIILNRIQTFGEHPAGLGKFTRTMFARDMRRSVVAERAGKARAS